MSQAKVSLGPRLDDIFKSYDPNQFDPTDCLERVTSTFDEACVPRGECDPTVQQLAEHACNLYGGASLNFIKNGFQSAAVGLLVDAWNKFAQLQMDTRSRIYRAGLGMYLAKRHSEMGDTGACLRWALYTQADDILGEHPAGGGAGRHWLHTILGMSQVELDALNRSAAQNVHMVKNELENNWACPRAFAEDAVMRFALDYPEYAHLFASETTIREYPLTPAYYGTLFDALETSHRTTTEKGDALEELASYLFLLIPGCVPRRNLLDEQGSFETDLVVRNLTRSSNLAAEPLGRHFLVECKNWENPVGVQDVGYFLYRMRLTHATFGVLFAKSGITGGTSKEENARSLIRKAFHEDGSTCVVVSHDDLLGLKSQERSLWSLLSELMERMRFGKPRGSRQAVSTL